MGKDQMWSLSIVSMKTPDRIDAPRPTVRLLCLTLAYDIADAVLLIPRETGGQSLHTQTLRQKHRTNIDQCNVAFDAGERLGR